MVNKWRILKIIERSQNELMMVRITGGVIVCFRVILLILRIELGSVESIIITPLGTRTFIIQTLGNNRLIWISLVI